MNRELTPELVRELLDYDPEAGVLTWRPRPQEMFEGRPEWVWKGWNARFAGKVAGSVKKSGYVYVALVETMVSAHRLAFAHYHGHWPNGDVDHINRVKGDNRISNLRDVDRSVNNHNRRLAGKNSKSGVLGVWWAENMGKWVTQIRVNGKKKHIGSFDSQREAHEAYLEAKSRMLPGVAA